MSPVTKPPLPWTASDWLAANDKLASIQQWSLIAKTRTFLHWRLNRLMHVEVSCHSYPQLGLTWIFVFAVQCWLSSHRVKDIFLFAVLNVKYIFVRSRSRVLLSFTHYSNIRNSLDLFFSSSSLAGCQTATVFLRRPAKTPGAITVFHLTEK